MAAKPALGLFFTDHFVEISQISAEGTKLIRFNQLPLPQNVIVNGEIRDSNTLLSVIKKLMATAKPRPIRSHEEVVIGIPDNRVFLREFALPRMIGHDIEEAINFQIKSLLPVLPADVQTDWEIIGQDADGKIEVLLVAVPKNIIDSYFSTVAAAGLQVVAIEPSIFANIRTIRKDQFKGKDQLLVFLGDDFSVFAYLTNGNPRFTDFMLNAEILKKGNIINVIHDYVNFANSKHPNRPVTEILVSGYNVQTEAVVNYLISEKNKAILAESRLTTAVVKNHSLLHTAHGLSLKTIDLGSSPNLLPMDFRLEVTRKRFGTNLQYLLWLLILMTAVGVGYLFYYYQSLTSKQDELTALKGQYETQLKSAQNKDLIARTDEINALSDEFILFREAAGGEEGVMHELSATTLTGITLSSFIIARGQSSTKLADTGSSWIVIGTANSRDVVLSFYNRLLSMPDFSYGKLYFGSLAKDTAITFRIASQETQ